MSKVAAIQMVSGKLVEQNLDAAAKLVAAAAQAGAELALLPENFALMSSATLLQAGTAEIDTTGPVRAFCARMARQHELWLVAGSIPIRTCGPDGTLADRVRAACLVYDPRGAEVARYDKIHLFDVKVADRHGNYCESEFIEPGSELRICDTPFAKLGLSICYDLRFPELYRALTRQGAQLLTVPAAFTAKTGEAHWQVLLRARAIENQCYVIGAGQGGQHSEKRYTWGHSMIVDPWGEVLDECAQGQGFAIADIDLAVVEQLRGDMPVSEHRRLDLY